VKRLYWHKTCPFFLAAQIVFFLIDASVFADRTYTLVNYPSDQYGWTLSGSITTDGTVGDITSGNIRAWNWAIEKEGASFSYDSTNSEAEFWPDLSSQRCFHATPTDLSVIHGWWASLTYTPDGYSSTDCLSWNWWDDGSGVLQPFYDCWASGTPQWISVNPNLVGPNGWVIASVPEPSTCALLLTASLGGLLCWRRRGKA
jgi:hypothetical protein